MQQRVRGLKTVTHLKGYIALNLNFWFCSSWSTHLHCLSAANVGAISDVYTKKKIQSKFTFLCNSIT